METIYKTPALYKKDTSGNLRIWRGEAFTDDQGIPYYKTIAGRLTGKQKENITEAKPSAKLTAEEAALSKIKSAEASKLKSGYFEDQQEAMDYVADKLMIIHKWPDHKDRISFPCLVQPKLDGVCAGYMDDPNDPHFKSRENNRFPKLDPLAKEIHTWLDAHHGIDRIRMDAHGELYVHGKDVGELVEGIKGSNPGILAAIDFCIFDFMTTDAANLWYTNRLKHGLKFYGTGEVKKPFRIVKILVAQTEADIDGHYKAFVQEGYEGAVICNNQGQYEYERRTYNKLKYKQLFSEEFEIVGFDVELNGSDKLIMFKCITDDHKVFKVRPKWSHEKRAEAYADQMAHHIDYVGCDATVEYRSVTQYGTPFHPVLITVRDYE